MLLVPPKQPLLLASDLDNTLVGDPGGLAAFLRWLLPRRWGWLLAYVTGRGWDSAWDLIRSAGLTPPDALITDVGTAIHVAARYRPASLLDYRADSAWDEQLQAQWPGPAVDELAAGIAGLQPQPGITARLRRSYWVDQPGAVDALDRRVRTAGLAVRTVYSSGRDLDLIPGSAGKGPALRYLLRRWQLPPWRVLVCGDSGNDLDMLTMGCTGVVVANAAAELADTDLPPQVYRARQAYAWGVLEGVQWWVQRGRRGREAAG